MPWWLSCLLLLLLLRSEPAAAQEGPEPLRVTVISYNVWGVPWIAPQRVARLREIGKRLGAMQPDLVAIQELWLPEEAALLGDPLRDAGLPHQRYFGATETDVGHSGLWIASRFPILETTFESFTAGRRPFIPWHVDWTANKGIARVVVDTRLGPLEFVNTHLQSDYPLGRYQPVQLSQLIQLADYVNTRHGRMPSLVTGDFNVSPSSLPFRTLLAHTGLRPAASFFDIDAILARSSPQRRLAMIGVGSLWTDPEHVASLNQRRPLSDHPCLFARYELSACHDCSPDAGARRRVANDAKTYLIAEQHQVRRLIRGTRILALALPVLVLLLYLRYRRLARRRYLIFLAGVGSLLLLTVAAWLGYLGWSYGPYQLDFLANLQSLAAERLSIEGL